MKTHTRLSASARTSTPVTPLLVFAMLLGAGATFPLSTAEAQTGSAVRFGFPEDEITAVKSVANAVAPGGDQAIGYSLLWGNWVTPGTIEEEWFASAVQRALDQDTTPVILFYFFGDHISPDCVELGWGSECDGDKNEWNRTRDMYVRILRDTLDPIDGDQAIVVIENEFHKNGITDNWNDPSTPEDDTIFYPDRFDAYLEAHNAAFHTVEGVKTVIGFGHWAADNDDSNGNAYKHFPRGVRTSDMLGSMILYSAAHPGGSDRKPDTTTCSPGSYEWGDRPAEYLKGIDKVYNVLNELWAYYGVDGEYTEGPDLTESIIYDLGFASFNDTEGDAFEDYCIDKDAAKRADVDAPYSRAEQEADGKGWEDRQAQVLDTLFDKLPNFKAIGLKGVVFRAYTDGRGNTPETNHHVLGEWWFGLRQMAVFDADGREKAAHDPVFTRMVQESGRPVGNQPPVASFTSSCTDATCSFDASASDDPDGTIASYAWDFGDQSPQGGGETTTHTYAASGTYTVTLTVTDNEGATDTYSDTVSVTVPSAGNQPPTAAYTYSCSGRTCSFDGSGSTDPDGTVADYRWEFGDGRTGTGATTSYTYGADGTYDVRLTVFDDAGAADEETKSVPVSSGSTFLGTHESEASDYQTAGQPYTNYTFSGGAGWLLHSNGYIQHNLTNDATDDYRLVIRVKGDLGSAYPHMVLHVNGQIAGEWDVASTEPLEYETTHRIEAGATELKIEFTNDDTTGGDRNLKLDFLRIEVASSDLPGMWEAEDFDYKDTGGLKTDPTYSGGAGWNIWANGYIEQKAYNGLQGDYRVTIRAEGDLAGSEYPLMRLWINGQYVQDWSVVSEDLLDYPTTVTLPEGEITFRIYFANDENTASGDRNLEVDYMQVEARTSQIPGTVEAEDFDDKSTGGLITSSEYSGGEGWNLWANGSIEQTLYNGASGTYTIRIKAEADLAGAEYPHMVLKIDGVQVAAWDVVSEDLLYYGTTQTLGAGDVTFRIEFTNDYYDPDVGADRNLEIDLMRIEAV